MLTKKGYRSGVSTLTIDYCAYNIAKTVSENCKVTIFLLDQSFSGQSAEHKLPIWCSDMCIGRVCASQGS